MLTKNFYSFVLGKGLKTTISKSLTSTEGTVYDHSYYYNNSSDMVFSCMSSFTSSATGSGVMIGTGTTPATAGDYKLEAQITTGVTFSGTTNVSYNIDDDGYSMFTTGGVKNTGTEPIAVSEVGLVCRLYYGTSSSNLCNVLLDRTVLEEPITINPGETKQLTYTIRMNYPTA